MRAARFENHVLVHVHKFFKCLGFSPPEDATAVVPHQAAWIGLRFPGTFLLKSRAHLREFVSRSFFMAAATLSRLASPH